MWVVGWFARVTGRRTAPQPTLRTFSAGPVDEVITSLRSATGPVSRAEALTVPAVARGRDSLCGSIAALPLVQRDRENRIVPNLLLEQLDADVANVVTIAQLVEDLIFCGIAWLEKTAYDWTGRPASVRRVAPELVSLTPPSTSRSPSPLPSGVDPRNATIWLDGRETSAANVIRFDAPGWGLLTTAAPVIRRALSFSRAALLYADSPAPGAVLVPAQGSPALDQTKADEMAASYLNTVRRRGAVVMQDVEIRPSPGANPQELQLVQLANQAALEIAVMMGLDPEDVGQNVTPRTYFNATDRRQSRINDTLSPLMLAISQRLSMRDVTPAGHKVAFRLDDYLKADPATRWQTYQVAVDMGAKSLEEVRAEEGLPPGAPGKPEPPAPPPMPEPAEEPIPEEVPA